MGKMILCSGSLTKVPFVFELSEMEVYSIEELCYYLYHNIYEITEDIFGEKLIEWLRKQADMPLIANKLTRIREAGGNLKDIVVSIFCSCDYYTEYEIKQMIQIMDEISNQPYYRKQKIKADNYLKYKRYRLAVMEYEKLLSGGMAINFDTVEYGDIIHNLSVAYLHVDRLAEAVKGFKDAYSRNQKKESMRQYLMALLLFRRGEEFEKEIINMGLDPKTAQDYQKEIEEQLVLANDTGEIRELKYQCDRAEETKDSAILKNLENRVLEWKSKYQEDMNVYL